MQYGSHSGEFDSVSSGDRCVDAVPTYTATQLTVTFRVKRTLECGAGSKEGARGGSSSLLTQFLAHAYTDSFSLTLSLAQVHKLFISHTNMHFITAHLISHP